MQQKIKVYSTWNNTLMEFNYSFWHFRVLKYQLNEKKYIVEDYLFNLSLLLSDSYLNHGAIM